MSSIKKNKKALAFDPAAIEAGMARRAGLSAEEGALLDQELIEAVESGALKKALAALMAGASAQASSPRRQSPLYLSARSRKGHQIAPALIRAGAPLNQLEANGETALLAAIQGGRKYPENAWALLTLGADPRLGKNREGKSCLHMACSDALAMDELVEALIGAGAEVDARDARLFTPLHYAALNGFESVCRTLIAKGADVEALTKNGNTPLHKAAEASQAGAIEVLLSAGAQSDLTNHVGETPLARQIVRSKSASSEQALHSKNCLESVEERNQLGSAMAPARAPRSKRGL